MYSKHKNLFLIIVIILSELKDTFDMRQNVKNLFFFKVELP